MIKLELSKKPIELTQDEQDRLTQEFKDSGNKASVYKKSYIENAVKALAFGKCCFSEIKLDTKSTYTEIEHFYPKDLYPDEVVSWGNLIPSSKKCNTSKGKTDTKEIEIINPFIVNPGEHIYFSGGRLYTRDEEGIGRNTIDFLSLNDRFHFSDPRAILSIKVIDAIEALYLANFIDGDVNELTVRKKLNQINHIKALFAGINRKAEFSACIATSVKDAPFFNDLITALKKNDFWDDEFEEYLEEINFCYLGK